MFETVTHAKWLHDSPNIRRFCPFLSPNCRWLVGNFTLLAVEPISLISKQLVTFFCCKKFATFTNRSSFGEIPTLWKENIQIFCIMPREKHAGTYRWCMSNALLRSVYHVLERLIMLSIDNIFHLPQTGEWSIRLMVDSSQGNVWKY